jgi:hypothetical protein
MDPVESALPTMRNRHQARLCHGCRAPMTGQADHSWRGEARAPEPIDAERRNRPPTRRARVPKGA